MTAALIAVAVLAAIPVARRLLPLVWPDRAYRSEMARRRGAIAEYYDEEG